MAKKDDVELGVHATMDFADAQELRIGVGDWICFSDRRLGHQIIGNRVGELLWAPVIYIRERRDGIAGMQYVTPHGAVNARDVYEVRCDEGHYRVQQSLLEEQNATLSKRHRILKELFDAQSAVCEEQRQRGARALLLADGLETQRQQIEKGTHRARSARRERAGDAPHRRDARRGAVDS
jgi:hypothetical protein